MRTIGQFARFLSLAILLAVSNSNLFGQGFLIPEHDHPRMPRPWRQPVDRSYALRELTVDASIKQQVATTQVTQVFQNTGNVPIEATYVFPLPYDGAVERLTFMVDGKEYDAKLLPADEARRVYEGYVRKFKDPALLEWMGTGLFKTSVFPIPPGASRTVQLKYSQLLKQHDRITDYLFPMSTGRFTDKPLEKLSLRVALESAEPLKNIYSPTHTVNISRDDDRHAVVQLTAANAVPNSDFRLVFDSAAGNVQASLISCWPEKADQGYFLLLASPEIKQSDEKSMRKTVIFVIDQSGSMSGQKIEQARDAAKFVINNLRPDDQFNIIGYENDVKVMASELQRFGESSRSSALGFINGITSGGGTNIDGALSAATKLVTESQTPSYLVFLTDGLPTVGEVNELKIAENMRRNNVHRSRLISFGVGFDVNSRLLDRLTRENRGLSEYVRPNEDIEVAVSRLFKTMTAPVLTNMAIDYNFADSRVEQGPSVDRVYPKDLQDLFAGAQLVLVGRYRTPGQATIRLNGSVGSRNESFEFPVTFAARNSGDSYNFLPKLWAARRIGEIIDLLDLNGRNEELVKELTDLSTQYGILTPYTSFLADENSSVRELTSEQYRFQNTDLGLESLNRVSGADAVVQRIAKQQFKNAELKAGTGGLDGGRDAPSVGIAGGGGYSSGGAGLDPGGEKQVLSGLRQAGNQTLYKRGKTLVADNAVKYDLEKDKSKILNVTRYSDEYFQLVRDNSTAENQLLAAQAEDEELVVELRGKLYCIK